VLKDLGLSLDEIRQMLDGDPSPSELRGMLRLRRSQLERQAAQALERLRQVEIRLRQIEQEGTMPQIDVLLKQVGPLTVVGAREVVPSPEQMRDRCIALNAQACELIESASLKTNGISFALYYSDAQSGIDVEMAYVIEPVQSAPTSPNKASVHALPTETVAYAVYNGSYDDFGAVGQVHGALHQWIDENGYRVTGAVREFYLSPPTTSPIGVMEIQYPVETVN
jgi:effector-binding domain-containing protein